MDNSFNVVIDNPVQVVEFLKNDVVDFYQKFTMIQALKVVQALYSEYHYRNYQQFLTTFIQGKISSERGPLYNIELVTNEWFVW